MDMLWFFGFSCSNFIDARNVWSLIIALSVLKIASQSLRFVCFRLIVFSFDSYVSSRLGFTDLEKLRNDNRLRHFFFWVYTKCKIRRLNNLSSKIQLSSLLIDRTRVNLNWIETQLGCIVSFNPHHFNIRLTDNRAQATRMHKRESWETRKQAYMHVVYRMTTMQR